MRVRCLVQPCGVQLTLRSFRFMTMYNLAMGLEGRIFDCTLLAQSTLPPAAALKLWRHLNAAHVLLYLGVSALKTCCTR